MPAMSSNDVMALIFITMVVCCGCIPLMRLLPSADRALQVGRRAVRAYTPRLTSMSFSSTSGQLSAVLSQAEPQSETTPAAVTTLPVLSLMTAGNILVVGPSGSGKSTLLRHLATVRQGAVVALDPHNVAGSWHGIPVFGGGLEWTQIGTVMQKTYDLMQRRYQALDSGTERDFTPLTLVSDEYRAIVRALPGNRQTGERAASEILRDLITQARKVRINVLAASQSDTVESLGFTGESDLKACFQYVVYLGALAVRKAPNDVAFIREMEQCEHKAVAVHTETGRVALLHLPPLAVMQQAYRIATDSSEIDQLVAQLSAAPAGKAEAETTSSAPERHTAELSAALSEAQIVDVAVHIVQSARAGTGKTATLQSAPGYSGRRHAAYAALYDRLKSALEPAERTSERAHAVAV